MCCDPPSEPVVISGWLAGSASVGAAVVAKARRGGRVVSSGPAPSHAEAFRRLRERLDGEAGSPRGGGEGCFGEEGGPPERSAVSGQAP